MPGATEALSRRRLVNATGSRYLRGGFLTLEAPPGWAQQVGPGGTPSKSAAGWVPTRDQHKGDRVCFAGRTTGADQCGWLVKRYSLVAMTQTCTDIDGHQGDSGGPLCRETDGATARAVGIVAVVVRRA